MYMYIFIYIYIYNIYLFVCLFVFFQCVYSFILVCNISLCKLYVSLYLFLSIVNRKLYMESSHGIVTKEKEKKEKKSGITTARHLVFCAGQ